MYWPENGEVLCCIITDQRTGKFSAVLLLTRERGKRPEGADKTTSATDQIPVQKMRSTISSNFIPREAFTNTTSFLRRTELR